MEALAKHFAIRRERVLAILALARMEREMLDQGKQIFPELREIARKAYGPGYAKGNGERHIAFVPTYPRYKLVSPEEVEDVQTPSYEELVQKRSREEEDVLVQEFKERLDFNTGVTGKGLSRQSRFINAPRRPKEGWSLMIKPLGKNAPAEYVGLPDGTQREPNEDELLFIRQKMPRLRRRIE